MPDFQKVDAARRAHESDLFSYPNVIGIGTGYRQREGRFTSDLCVHVFVDSKQTEADLGNGNIVPRQLDPSAPEPVETDIIEITDLEGYIDPGKYRPVQGGCSIGQQGVYFSGTLGGFAFDNVDNTVVFLSCNHVFGGFESFPDPAEVMQPSRFLGGSSTTDIIGRVIRQVPLITRPAEPRPDTVPLSTVDAAIGVLDFEIPADFSVIDIGPAIFATRSPREGMQVAKRGAATEATLGGEIVSVNDKIRNKYRNGSIVAEINNIFMIEGEDDERFSSEGDSGAVILARERDSITGTMPMAGLLIGGGMSEGQHLTIANDVDAVFAALNLSPIGVTISRRAINFGAVPQNDIATRTIDIVNRTAEPVTIALDASQPPVTVQPPNGFFWRAVSRTAVPGQTVRIVVEFTPRAEQDYAGQLEIRVTPGDTIAVPLSGRGRPSPSGPDGGPVEPF